MICVYEEEERDFTTNGIKLLHPQKAVIYKEDNGKYYIELKDTIENMQYYQAGMIIKASSPWGYQCFRLTNPQINNKKIDVIGNHLYFDSKNYIIKDSYVVDKNCNDALDHLNSATDIQSPFTTISDILNINSFRCVRKSLEEAILEIINRWGGHLVRNNWNIEIREKIGQDRGVVLSYAKNIEKIEDKSNWDDVVTKILPVGKDGLLLPETYLTIEEDLYKIPYTRVVDIDQSDIEEDDYKVDGELNETAYTDALIEDLRMKGNNYLQENKLPKINYTVSAYIKDVSDVGDTIYVKHPKCNIDIITNVISITYDVIAQKYTSIEFGNFKNKLKDLISNVNSAIEEQTNKTIETAKVTLRDELTDATNKIIGILENSYVVTSGSEILILDKLPKEEAVNVIRLNSAGIGFSQNGINGPFNSAWSIDGTLDMQQINVINLVADMIKGGTLKLGTKLNQAGLIEIYDESNKLIGEINKDGFKMYAKDDSYILINPEVGFAGYDRNGNKIYWVDGDEFHQKKAFVEEEITIGYKMRMIPITNSSNTGIGFVPLV